MGIGKKQISQSTQNERRHISRDLMRRHVAKTVVKNAIKRTDLKPIGPAVKNPSKPLHVKF